MICSKISGGISSSDNLRGAFDLNRYGTGADFVRLMSGPGINRTCHVKDIESLLLAKTLELLSELKMRCMYSPCIASLFAVSFLMPCYLTAVDFFHSRTCTIYSIDQV